MPKHRGPRLSTKSYKRLTPNLIKKGRIPNQLEEISMGEKKAWYSSKLLWVGLVTAVWGVLQTLGILDIPLNENTLAIVLGVIVFILRLATGKPIELRKK